jgi:serine/threonine protein kinase
MKHNSDRPSRFPQSTFFRFVSLTMNFSDEIMREVQASLAEHEYQMICPVGAGAFGVVYRVKSLRYDNQEFAVKVSASPTGSAPLIDNVEFKVLLGLAHPNILGLYSQWQTEHCLCIVLEYAPNGSLEDVLRESGPLTLTTFRTIAHQCLDALAYCHSCNFFHGDIKPANILLDAHSRVKLADFGLAGQRCDGESLPMKGSLPYMSPELIRGRSTNGAANDIWALGITFLELLTGKVPWRSRDRAEIQKEIVKGLIHYPTEFDAKLVSALQRMLEGSADCRASAAQLMLLPGFAQNADSRRSTGALAVVGAQTIGIMSAGLSQHSRKLGLVRSMSMPRNRSASNLTPFILGIVDTMEDEENLS